VSVEKVWVKESLVGEIFLFRVVDLDSSEDLFLLVSFIVDVNLLFGSDLRAIGCGVGWLYLSWDNHYSYIG
jgi:hypothetical protein